MEIEVKRRYFIKAQKVSILNELSISGLSLSELARCLVAGEDIMLYKGEKTKEELWDKYYTQVPAQRRRPVERYKIVKRA